MKNSHKVLFGAVCALTNLITFLVVQSINQTSFRTDQCQRCMTLHQPLYVPGYDTERPQLSPDNCTSHNSPSHNSTHPTTPPPSPCVCTLQNITTVKIPQLTSDNIVYRNNTVRTLAENGSLRPIFVVSPTYSRLTQKSDLTTVCTTLMHIPNLVWIVVEDSSHRTDLVTNLLGHCSIASVHLTAVTPAYYKRDKWKPRGVLQRNAGLSWIREHFSHRNCNGVVYFGDDDNSYDLRVFDAMRKTERVSVWAVAFSGGVKVEGPECEDGVVKRWHSGWGADRKFPIDMAGFAINVCLLMKHPNVLIGKDKAGKLSKPGHLESNLLEQLVSKELLECRGPPKEIIVWHVKTAEPDVSRDGKNKKTVLEV